MTSIETEREIESPPDPVRLRRLRIEFCIIFLAVPLAYAAFIDTLGALTPLFVVFGVAAILLTVTPGCLAPKFCSIPD